MDWWLGKDGQKAVVKGWMHPVRGDVEAPLGSIPTSKIAATKIKIDWQDLSDNNAKIKENFRKRMMDR